MTDAAASVVQSTQYYPFGSSFADVSGTSTQPYKYNGKELDGRNGLNMYDYSARWKDDFSFTTIDPLAEKKPWLNPYHYTSNNPINRIDPDGKDDYFNSQGGFEKSTKTGSNIYVNLGGKDVRLSDINLSSQENRQTVANVVGYYAIKDVSLSIYAKGPTPIGNHPMGTVGLKYHENSDVPAFANGYDIWVNTKGDRVSETLNDANNLVNTLVHEAEHKSQNTDPNKSGLKGPIREINAIQTQMEHSSYSKTTKDNQKSTLGYLIKQINNSSMSDNAVTKIVDKANSLNKNYRIEYSRYGGATDAYTIKIVKIK